MPGTRPYVLSLAGFDPSGGAGILADCKTFEAHKVMGLGVTTAITFQNESAFAGVNWVSPSVILGQAELLLQKYEIKVAKIGLIENLTVLDDIINYLLSVNRNMKIIWDPVLKASAGYLFHQDPDRKQIETILKKIYLITPNKQEQDVLGIDPLVCRLLVKGGHNTVHPGRDYLYTGAKTYSYKPGKIVNNAKHGSGCVLSAAIAANLAKGYKIHKSCVKAKSYTERFLDSNDTLLGYHRI